MALMRSLRFLPSPPKTSYCASYLGLRVALRDFAQMANFISPECKRNVV